MRFLFSLAKNRSEIWITTLLLLIGAVFAIMVIEEAIGLTDIHSVIFWIFHITMDIISGSLIGGTSALREMEIKLGDND